ncbi:MAG: HEAT repeat domain-containing protein [Deltaproteobacteria bacterium]|nr:HEAT repeat domain-containing protein [Deltaproteobacteria bacterium]
MVKINPAAFITEIKNNIAEKDALKANIVLSHLAEMALSVQREALDLFWQSEPDFAIPLLAAVLDKFPYLSNSFPDLKERLVARILEAPAVYLALLQDEKAASRGYLVELAGELGLEDAYHVLMAMLVNEADYDLLEKVVIALGEIGDSGAAANIAELLYTENFELVKAAVKALGQIGSATAIHRLNEKLGYNPELDFLILDVFFKVQSQEAIKKINDTLTSHHAHIRSKGKEKLVALGSKALPVLAENLLQGDPDLLIHTLNVMGDIGDEGAISSIRKLIHNQPRDANVRFAAYEALGRLPLAKGAYVLASGLHDPVDNVRSAAAAAIDSNYNEILAAGLKNMVRGEDAEALDLVRTIISTQSGTIFLDLLEIDFFRKNAFECLTERAHSSVREYFISLLKENGFVDEVAQLTRGKDQAAASPETAKKRVVAIDDSKMILGIFRSMLHALGYEPFIFINPEVAVEEVIKLKPDAVLTDLNMPGITGIEVTRRLRRTFSRDELPVIMVTTQNENQDNEAAKAAGVNEILHKPFTKEGIGEALARYLG